MHIISLDIIFRIVICVDLDQPWYAADLYRDYTQESMLILNAVHQLRGAGITKLMESLQAKVCD